MKEFDKLKGEVVKFMRGKYKLNEEAGMHYDVPCVKFRQGKKTIVSVNLLGDCYEFQVILGKAEREKFEAIKDEFSENIRNIYDNTPALHDGKWLFVRADNVSDFEEIKKLILLKKNPNRKPLSKEGAVYGKCGHRCDMCVHYTGMAEEKRTALMPHLDKVYGSGDWGMRCTGCDTEGCQCYTAYEICEPLKCHKEKKINNCAECENYPCEKATVGYRDLEHRDISADDVTCAILPYVPKQYED